MNTISHALDTLLQRFPEADIRRDEPMSRHTSFRIGGAVRAMLFPKSAEEMKGFLQTLREAGVEPLVIGNGTNLLVQDGELDLVVIKTQSGLSQIRRTGETEITAGSGTLLSRLAVFAQEQGLGGIEFAHGIPGTLGGAVLMNAGAYGGEMKDVVVKTAALAPDGGEVTVEGEAHGFAYRKSRFEESGEVILASTLSLYKKDPGEIAREMEALAQRRRESQPLTLPSAGSTFKRPKTGYAAALIDEAGLKGFRIGGAAVSEKHAGFVVNLGGATFGDVLAVMEHIQKTVFARCGVELEPEVRIIRAYGRP
ncbi:MAG TPA: UDP-N-acetylmuramate dehydrogenase [Papillibacter sp.]|nr:UDP-N-acetylmuramate dehydrogenase [Papillibacter sp.]